MKEPDELTQRFESIGPEKVRKLADAIAVNLNDYRLDPEYRH